MEPKNLLSFFGGIFISISAAVLKSWLFEQFHILTFLSIMGLFSLFMWYLYHLEFLDKIPIISDWVRKKKKQIYFLTNLLGVFSSPSSSNFSINSKSQNKSASIIYSRYGKEHILNIPYQRESVSKMTGLSVFLIKNSPEGPQTINITQQPGIPYFVSAYDLGGEEIYIIKNSTKEIIHKCEKYEIPK